EELLIQPQPRKDENSYRWNWDAPLVISKHKTGRVYFAANKVFRTDNYGNSWEVISDDITAQIDRNKLPVMGRIWGMDAVMKNGSTSQYGTIVAMDESPLDENLIIIGTDDGLIQITENGGQSWRKTSSFSGVPLNTYVNMVLPSQHNKNVIYACFNDHKRGNFKPYVYKSSDKGATWKSITANLPDRGHSFAIAEDHVDPNLLFVGTEFGVFFTNNGGKSWKQLKAGVPTIAVRDIDIQKRENDLVLGTFGRGFYVLDDYSSLRNISENSLKQEGSLFSVRDAWQFQLSFPYGLPNKAFQGDGFYMGENLGSEALITYYIKDKVESLKDKRKKTEKKLNKDGKNVAYPSYDDLKAEQEELDSYLLFEIKDENGQIVRRVKKKFSKGVNRFKWDMRYAPKDPVSFSKPSFYNPWGGVTIGPKVFPGAYTVTMYKHENGTKTAIGEPQSFKVKSLNNKVLPADDLRKLAEFQFKVEKLSGRISGTGRALGEVKNQIRHIKVALMQLEDNEQLFKDVLAIEKKIQKIELKLNGDRTASRLDIDTPPSVRSRIGNASWGTINTTSGPTKTHVDSYNIALEEFKPLLEQVKAIIEQDMNALNSALIKAGAPYTPGTLPVIDDLK
ncbi:MAG: sialidase family protein, partial [Bacteroidota bacterium]